MGITVFPLTAGGDVAVASKATGVVSPSSGALQLLAVGNWTGSGVNPNVPTVTGNGLTWVAVLSWLYDDSGTGRGRLTVFRALGPSPSAGAATIDFGGQVQDRVAWSWCEMTGVDASGVNGSGAIVQYGQAPASPNSVQSTLVVSLSAFESASNVAYGALGVVGNDTDIAPGTGFTEIHEQAAGGNRDLHTQYALNDNTVDWSNVSSGSFQSSGAIAIEVRAAASVITMTAGNVQLGSGALAARALEVLLAGNAQLGGESPSLRANQAQPAGNVQLAGIVTPAVRLSAATGAVAFAGSTVAIGSCLGVVVGNVQFGGGAVVPTIPVGVVAPVYLLVALEHVDLLVCLEAPSVDATLEAVDIPLELS